MLAYVRVADFRFQAGELARRWWKVGLPILVLAVVVVVALVAGGGDTNQPETSGSTIANVTTEKPSVAHKPTHHKQKKGGGSKHGSGSSKHSAPTQGSGASAAGSGSSTQGSEPASGPGAAYGPPGTPAGEVPPGASQSANEQAVALTLSNFLKSISRADGPQACAQLSPEGRRRVDHEVHHVAPETRGSPCEGAIVLYQGAYGKKARHPQITDVRVAGDQATATGPPDSQRANLSKRGNVWLIDNYGWD
jgi:hypothetical protein